MANTVNRIYPYPGVNDAPDGPYAVQRLAEAVDVDVKAQSDRLDKLPVRLQVGQDSIFIGAAVAVQTQTITFPVAFATAPKVVASLVTATAGRASLLNIQVTASTTTGFTARLYTSDNANTGTSYTIAFNWIAAA
jgi:hypothetical protein